MRGVATVFSAILLIVIIAGAFSLFAVTLLPEMRANKSIDHMMKVRSSLARLKWAVEDLKAGESITLDIKMSPDTVPFFGGPEAAGRLAVTPSLGENNFGTLLFEISNPDYVDQKWVFEGGAIILCQPVPGRGWRSIMDSPPAMLVAADNQGNNIRIDLWLYYIKGITGSSSRKGYVSVDCSVLLENLVVYPGNTPNASSVSLNIDNTSYPDAWLEYLSFLYDQLAAKGYNPQLIAENLELIIRGKVTDPAINDIYFFKHVKYVELKIW
jgi:hypothetical protein